MYHIPFGFILLLSVVFAFAMIRADDGKSKAVWGGLLLTALIAITAFLKY